MSPAVAADGVSLAFGSRLALNEVSFELPTGAVCALVGPNGAGKTTLLRVLASLAKPRAGLVRVGEVGTDDLASYRRQVGFVPDIIGGYDRLTVREYLELFADSNGLPKPDWHDRIAGVLELVDVSAQIDADLSALSRGMTQRVDLARAMLHRPGVLLLDEPAAGLDPDGRMRLYELVGRLAADGVTIVISSHVLVEIEQVADWGLALHDGEVRSFGPLGVSDTVTVEVRFDSGEIERFVVPTASGERALVRRLVVDEGREVVAMARVGNLAQLLESTAGFDDDDGSSTLGSET